MSASGTDPRRRYSIKMQRSWNKTNSALWAEDFQGIAGLSSDDFLLVGVNSARVSFKNAALSNIGSMSPARLSLGTVASPHCRLLFHLAKGILAEHQRGLSGQFRTKRLSSLTGAGSQATVLRFRSGEKYFLDIPFYRSGCYANHPGVQQSRASND